MNENQFTQFVSGMLRELGAQTDWLFENQQREVDAHDQRLAAAEAVLRKALDFIAAERAKFRPQAKENLRQLHDNLAKTAGSAAPQLGKQVNKQPF